MKVTKIMKGKRLLPLVALAAMSLVACGGGNKKSSDQPSQPDTSVPAEEPAKEQSSFGCGGSIIATSSLIALMSLAGVGAMLLKRRKEN